MAIFHRYVSHYQRVGRQIPVHLENLWCSPTASGDIPNDMMEIQWRWQLYPKKCRTAKSQIIKSWWMPFHFFEGYNKLNKPVTVSQSLNHYIGSRAANVRPLKPPAYASVSLSLRLVPAAQKNCTVDGPWWAMMGRLSWNANADLKLRKSREVRVKVNGLIFIYKVYIPIWCWNTASNGCFNIPMWCKQNTPLDTWVTVKSIILGSFRWLNMPKWSINLQCNMIWLNIQVCCLRIRLPPPKRP